MFKSKTGRIIHYIALNSIFAASIYYGLFQGHEGAANLAVFMGWMTGIMGTLVLVALSINQKKRAPGDYIEFMGRQDPSPIPYAVDLMFDICVCIAFIWTGYQWLTLFYIVSIFAVKAMRDVPKNEMLNKLQGQKS